MIKTPRVMKHDGGKVIVHTHLAIIEITVEGRSEDGSLAERVRIFSRRKDMEVVVEGDCDNIIRGYKKGEAPRWS